MSRVEQFAAAAELSPSPSWQTQHAARYYVYEGVFHSTPLHFHPQCELALVTEGTGRVRIGGSTYDVEAGTMVLAGSNVVHEWLPSDGITKSVVLFELGLVNPLMAHNAMTETLMGVGSRIAPVVAITSKAELRDVRRTMHRLGVEHRSARLGTFQMVGALLVDLVIGFLRQVEAATPPAQSDPQPGDVVAEVIAHLHEHYTEPIDRVRVARLFGMAPVALGRLFRQQCGLPLAQYLMRLRVDHAAGLLQDTTLSAREVSSLSGFDSYRTFARTFHAVYGMSPAELRRGRSGLADDVDVLGGAEASISVD